jgi:hypothetical protein
VQARVDARRHGVPDGVEPGRDVCFRSQRLLVAAGDLGDREPVGIADVQQLRRRRVRQREGCRGHHIRLALAPDEPAADRVVGVFAQRDSAASRATRSSRWGVREDASAVRARCPAARTGSACDRPQRSAPSDQSVQAPRASRIDRLGLVPCRPATTASGVPCRCRWRRASRTGRTPRGRGAADRRRARETAAARADRVGARGSHPDGEQLERRDVRTHA